jgi:hypothetical protein
MAMVVRLAHDELSEESAELLVISRDEAEAAIAAVARALALARQNARNAKQSARP